MYVLYKVQWKHRGEVDEPSAKGHGEGSFHKVDLEAGPGGCVHQSVGMWSRAEVPNPRAMELSMEKLSSMKPVPSAKKVGDHWSRARGRNEGERDREYIHAWVFTKVRRVKQEARNHDRTDKLRDSL